LAEQAAKIGSEGQEGRGVSTGTDRKRSKGRKKHDMTILEREQNHNFSRKQKRVIPPKETNKGAATKKKTMTPNAR